MSAAEFSTIEIPISIRWKISKSKLLEIMKPIGYWSMGSQMYKVEKFPGIQYHLRIKKDDAGSDKAMLGLAIDMEEQIKFKAVFDLKIDSANLETRKAIIYERKQICGMSLLIEELLNDENGFFIDGYMIVVIEGVLIFDKSASEVVSKFRMISDNLGPLLWDRDDDKDFTLVVGEKKIKVHKNVISAKSTVFDKMIKSGLKESIENKVVITDFDFEIVEIAMKFCYGINDERINKIKNAKEIIRFADKYDIKDLMVCLEQFLISEISPSNVCELANTSITSNSPKLREKCFNFLLECNQEKTFVKDLAKLDSEFAMNVFKASFAHSSM